MIERAYLPSGWRPLPMAEAPRCLRRRNGPAGGECRGATTRQRGRRARRRRRGTRWGGCGAPFLWREGSDGSREQPREEGEQEREQQQEAEHVLMLLLGAGGTAMAHGCGAALATTRDHYIVHFYIILLYYINTMARPLRPRAPPEPRTHARQPPWQGFGGGQLSASSGGGHTCGTTIMLYNSII